MATTTTTMIRRRICVGESSAAPTASAPTAALTVAALTVIDDVCVDLLDDLRVAVLSQEDRSRASAPTLNQGGWKSDEIFSWEEPCVAQLLLVLRRHVDDRLDRIERGRPSILVGWAMVNRRGSHHPSHRHQGSILSGVFCVDPGDEPNAPGAPTIFESDDGDVVVSAVPGRLTTFPGDLWHRVPPSGREGPRVTIAFDVRR